MAPVFSFVIPVLNEQETLPELARRLDPILDSLDGPSEVVLVDDGSTDASFEIMRSLSDADPRYVVVRLTRNFGHQMAISAGLEHASGDAVIIMDADLQDPPEVVLALVDKWREGFQVVYAVRDERTGESRTKLATARWFYRVLGRMSDVEIPRDAGDFRLVDRRVVDTVNAMPEHRRYLRGMFAWVGYDQVGVRYVREARHAGVTKFPMRRMLAFAADGIVSFVSVLAAGFGVVAKIASFDVVPGWASIVVPMGIIGGVQLVVLGVIGEYIARIYDEVKQRPLYLVREVVRSDTRP